MSDDKKSIRVINESKAVVPPAQKNFVVAQYFKDLKEILSTKQFFPIYLYGLSGVGKTSFVKQACHELKYPLVRVNLTENTTEDHLFGGFRLFQGETVYYKGPVIQAMEEGAILLLDEGDQAPPTVSMALQAILEGDSYLIKQTGELIHPKPGFNIILAANTKGRGDETGSFIGAQIQNEANLDRYKITFEHGYPTVEQETKIITNEFKLANINIDHEFNQKLIDHLVSWANEIRKAAAQNITSETMSTRRLIHYVSTYGIFNNKHKTLDLILKRFDTSTSLAWKEMFNKLDSLPQKVSTCEQYDKWKAEQEELKKAQKSGTTTPEKEWRDQFFDLNKGKSEVNPW